MTKYNSTPNDNLKIEQANKGQNLEELMNDPSHFVRAAVARQGFAPEVLSNDKYTLVNRYANYAKSADSIKVISNGDGKEKEPIVVYQFGNDCVIYSDKWEMGGNHYNKFGINWGSIGYSESEGLQLAKQIETAMKK